MATGRGGNLMENLTSVLYRAFAPSFAVLSCFSGASCSCGFDKKLRGRKS
jgi:hypothetical protein